MSFSLQISNGLTFAFLLGFIVSAIIAIIQFSNSRYSARQVAQTSIMKAIDLMESTRKDRHILYSIRNSKKPFSDWSSDEIKAADNAARAFDILAVLDSTGNIDHKFVDRFYAIPAIEIWSICEPFINKERESRGIQHLWEFEQFAGYVKNVKRNHPALSGKKKWSRNPRHKPLRF